MNKLLSGILTTILLLSAIIYIYTPFQHYWIYTNMISLEKWGDRIILRGGTGRNCGHGSIPNIPNLSKKVDYSQCLKQSKLKKMAYFDELVYAVYRGTDRSFTCELKIGYFPMSKGSPSSCSFSIYKTGKKIPLGDATLFISPPDW